MSKEYNDYIKEHKQNVKKAFQWMKVNLPEIFSTDYLKSKCECLCGYDHDLSKYSDEEYDAYDKYFYSENRSHEVINNFNLAWLHHIHNNPHHWQYWILYNDDPELGEILLDMPEEYIIEMICDWWSFSWKQDNLLEIFTWYEERKEHIKLSEGTRTKVENILSLMEEALADWSNNETDEVSAEIKEKAEAYDILTGDVE